MFELMNVVFGIVSIGVIILVVFGYVYFVVVAIRTSRLRTSVENVLQRVEAIEAQMAEKTIESRLEALETVVIGRSNN